MHNAHTGADTATTQQALAALTGARRRTLEALMRHPTPHNLKWADVVSLIDHIGATEEKPNGECIFTVAGRHLGMHKPHGKDLTSTEVTGLRHFLQQFGPAEAPAATAAPALLIVMDHHGARLFHVDATAENPDEHVIRPYDPHHFLHHLVHKDQSRERGQRAPEEAAYYEQIAAAATTETGLGGPIIVVGHGTGKSNAAHHFVEFLKDHHSQTYQRVVREVVADLSSITQPQLLELVRG